MTHPPSLKRLAPILCFLVMSLTSLIGLTWHNAFPYFYHTDEPVKCHQVDSNRINFYHPLVMINTSRLAYWASGERAQAAPLEKTQRYQKIVTVGRTVNAAFAAIALLTLMLTVYLRYGFWAGLAVGLPLSLSTALLHAGHILKEDAPLVMGMGLVFLASAWLHKRTTAGNLLCFALACATAGACKYPGLVFFPIGLGFIYYLGKASPLPSIVLGPLKLSAMRGFIVTFILAWVAWNHQLLFHPLDFLYGFGEEAEHVSSSHMGLVHKVPYLAHFDMLLSNVPIILLVAALFYVGYRLYRFRQNSWPQNLELVFALTYGFAASTARIFSFRYYIPVEVLAYYFAGQGLFLFTQMVFKQPKLRIACMAIALGASLIVLLPNYLRQMVEYEHDHRREALSWLIERVKLGEKVVQENSIQLHTILRRESAPVYRTFRRQILSRRYLSDLGTPYEICGKQVRYILVSNKQFDRYFDDKQRPTRRRQEEYETRKGFYQALFQKGKLVWKRAPGGSILQPGIQIYETTPAFCQTR